MGGLLLFGAGVYAPVWAADPGEVAFGNCYSCHSIDPAETSLPGPNLFGVIGRRIASQPGFEYSDGMKAFAKKNRVWTRTLIARFTAEPSAMVPGTPMETPPQLKKPDVRKNVLDYLARFH
jgi:cytochrome c